MTIFLEKFKIPQNTNLSTYLCKSNEHMSNFKKTAFQTSFLKSLICDKFEYQGTKPNTLLVQNKITDELTELQVDFEQTFITPDLIREDWKLFDKKGNLVGTKYYGIEKRPDNKIYMRTGSMTTLDNIYRGIGTRLDQLQIERALQTGIESIPRTAQPQATFFHVMMGFLPLEGRLIPVENNLAETMEKTFFHLNKIDFDPVLVEKNGKIYIDCNKTLANANLIKCKSICEKKGKGKIKKIDGKPTNLELSNDELKQWKEIIKNHSLLDKLNFTFLSF